MDYFAPMLHEVEEMFINSANKFKAAVMRMFGEACDRKCDPNEICLPCSLERPEPREPQPQINS